MAVTGRGTQDDPYIVHDYYELRATFPKQAKDEQGQNMGYTNPCYIELVSNIDGNDYGAEFEWEGLYTPSGYYEEASHTYLDLKGHTIKNIIIKTGQWFACRNRGGITISNGKIINVFGGGAAGLLSVNYLNHVSVGANLTGSNSGNTYLNINSMNACSIYFICKSAIRTLFSSGSRDLNIKNSDFYFDAYFYDLAFANVGVDGCRFRGRLTNKSGYGKSCNYNFTTKNSVYDLEWVNEYGDNALFDNSNTAFDSSNVLNKDKGSVYSLSPIQVTTEQLADADYLTNRGFLVVDISE